MRELGREVVLHRGRWWVRVVPGFYQPVHLLARMRPDEATRPTLRCWGLRASLAPESAASANGSIPAHVLPDPRGYDAGRLAPSQRRKLRKHLPEFDLVALDRPQHPPRAGIPDHAGGARAQPARAAARTAAVRALDRLLLLAAAWPGSRGLAP